MMVNWRSAFVFNIVLLFLVVSLTAQGSPPPLYFTDNVASTGVSLDVTDMEQALLDLINGATISIDLSIYDFNRVSIRDALIDAHNRGVVVRVVTDDEASEENQTYKPFYDALKGAGIAVVDDGRPADIMHNKFFVFDGVTVWTGSTNQTDNGFSKNHNNSIVFLNNADIAGTFTAQFNQMFVDGNFSRAKVPSAETQFTYNGIDTEVYFSPEDDALDAMIDEVNTAQESIYFSIFFFTDDGLRDAVIAAHNRGVRVRGVWDLLGASNAFSDDEALCDAGIPIKIENYIGKMHNKLMIVDVNGASPRVITGSMNWSASGDEDNDENTVILHDASLAQRYKTFWDTLYNGLHASTLCIPEPDEVRVFLPVLLNNFDPSTPPPVAESDVRITTITYNPDGSDVEGEVVQLQNVGTAVQDMTNWTLEDEGGSMFTFPSFSLDSGAIVNVWVTSGTDDATNLYWGRGSAVWNNGGDTAFLKDGSGVSIDTCTYEGGEQGQVCFNP